MLVKIMQIFEIITFILRVMLHPAHSIPEQGNNIFSSLSLLLEYGIIRAA
jgi:hypothetical protein